MFQASIVARWSCRVLWRCHTPFAQTHVRKSLLKIPARFPLLKSMVHFVGTWKQEVEIWEGTFGGYVLSLLETWDLCCHGNHTLPHLLMAAWWTSGGTPALSCKFILEKCRLTFKIFLCHFSSIPSWVLTSSSKLPIWSFRTTKLVWGPFPFFHA